MPFSKKFRLSPWSLAVPIILSSSAAAAFQSSFSGFTQCGVVDLEWWGAGSPPFSLVVVPFGSNDPFIVKIPDNSTTWNATSSRGIYKLPPIPLSAGTSFLVSLDDGNGFGTGGVSTVHTIGDSTDVSCLPTSSTQSTPELVIPAPPRQCEDLVISWDTSSQILSDRVFIRGWVPGGTSFALDPPPAMANVTGWTVDVPAGTQFVLMLSTGGVEGLDTLLSTTPLLTVEGNGLSKTSCFRGNQSPSSTVASIASLTTIESSASQLSTTLTSAVSSTQSVKSPSTAVIIGSVTGGVAALLLLASLLFWFYRRRKASDAQLDPITALDARPRPLVLRAAGSSASDTEGNETVPSPRTAGFLWRRHQKDRERTRERVGNSGIVASNEISPAPAQMESLGGQLSTGHSHRRHSNNSLGSSGDRLQSSTQPSSEGSPQSPTEEIVRHRDAGPVLVELPPLYEEASGPGRVGGAAPPTRRGRGSGPVGK